MISHFSFLRPRTISLLLTASLLLPIYQIEISQAAEVTETQSNVSDQELKDFAKKFNPAQNIVTTGDSIQYKLPAGITAKIIGSTFKQIIAMDGKIRRPISEHASLVTFELTNGKTKALTNSFEIKIPAANSQVSATPMPKVIPALQEWVGKEGSFSPSKTSNIFIVTGKSTSKADAQKLKAHMEAFAKDYEELTGNKIEVVTKTPKAQKGDFIVKLDNSKDLLALGNEGYSINAGDNLTITSSTPLGAFWATRSILQIFSQNKNTFPKGTIIDYPQYPVRGFMFDVGRKPVSLEMVYDVMKTMSYYKLNDLQLHLNDNFIWLHDYTKIPNNKQATPEQKKAAIAEVLKAAPTAFRLESSTKGKDGTPLTDPKHFYTKKEFGELIDNSRIYGVNIVPEIDVPGHAMSFVRVRPDLMYRGGVHKPHDVERAAMLDASSDIFDAKTGKTYQKETLSFVESVFDEYMKPQADGKPPVFRDAVVHIGTDEYYGAAEDYRAFADDLLKYCKKRGYTPRLWGSLKAKRGKTPVISEGVQMHIWSRDWQEPQPAIDMGYDIINILDAHFYIVPNGSGNMGAYQDTINLANLYQPNWHPHIMANKTVIPGHPKLLGAQFALWNDNSWRRDSGLIDFDLFDRIQNTAAVIAEKTWTTGSQQSFPEFKKFVSEIDIPPGINPRYEVESKSPKLLEMEFEDKNLQDSSGNSYDAQKANNIAFKPGKFGKALQLTGKDSYVKSGISNVAPGYTVEFWVNRSSNSNDPQVLMTSHTGSLYAVQKETGKMGITRDTWDYSFDYTLPVNEWVKIKLVSEGRNLTLYANDQKIGSPKRNQFPESHRYTSFVLPIEYIGSPTNSFNGLIDSLTVTKNSSSVDMSTAIPGKDMSATANSEQGSGKDGDISHAIDGKENTYWHSRYTPKTPPPFEVILTLKTPTKVGELSFLPRQDGENNGTIKHAELYLASTPTGDWKKVGEYRNDSPSKSRKSITFPAQEAAKAKWVIRDGMGGFGTMAEINLHRPSVGIAKKEQTPLQVAIQKAEILKKKSPQLISVLKKLSNEKETNTNEAQGIEEIHKALLNN